MIKFLFLTDAQKMGYYLEKKEFPFLHNFEEQRKKFEEVNYKKLDHSKVFKHMVAPTSMYPKHYVNSAIDNSSVLYGKDLAEPRGRYPSVKSVMDDHFLLSKNMLSQWWNFTSVWNKAMRISAKTI